MYITSRFEALGYPLDLVKLRTSSQDCAKDAGRVRVQYIDDLEAHLYGKPCVTII